MNQVAETHQDNDQMQGAGTTAALAKFGAETQFGDIPSLVTHQAKRLILDTLGCVVAAHPYEAAQIVEEVFESLGGPPEARSIPSGALISAPNAAYINGELANLLDLDDNLLNHTHFANTSVTAPLAIAESIGASGKSLIQAVVGAYEISSRLTLAQPNIIEWDGDWPDITEKYAQTHGMGFSVFGSVAGCANLMGATTSQMEHAFGIAGYGAPVPAASKATAAYSLSMKKYASYGQIGWTSTIAARLAIRGMTADTTVLDGPRGFWMMTGARDFDWEIAAGDLGSKWWILDTSFKFHPICTWNRQPIRAMQNILDENEIDPLDVESIEVRVHHTAASHGAWTLSKPESHLETQFSHTWAMAMTVMKVPGPLWQQPQTLDDPLAQSLASRTTVTSEPLATVAYYEQTGPDAIGVKRVRRSPATVLVHTRTGSLQSTVEYADGDPFSPETAATDAQLRDKFLEFGELAVPRAQLEDAADMLDELDAVDDVREITRLLCLQ